MAGRSDGRSPATDTEAGAAFATKTPRASSFITTVAMSDQHRLPEVDTESLPTRTTTSERVSVAFQRLTLHVRSEEIAALLR